MTSVESKQFKGSWLRWDKIGGGEVVVDVKTRRSCAQVC